MIYEMDLVMRYVCRDTFRFKTRDEYHISFKLNETTCECFINNEHKTVDLLSRKIIKFTSRSLGTPNVISVISGATYHQSDLDKLEYLGTYNKCVIYYHKGNYYIRKPRHLYRVGKDPSRGYKYTILSLYLHSSLLRPMNFDKDGLWDEIY